MGVKEIGCVEDFADAVASPAPAPGGGSVAAVCGALAAALARMVAAISLEKNEPGAAMPALRKVRRRAETLQDRLLELAEMDSDAYRAVVKAYKAPKKTEAQRRKRSANIRRTLIRASEIPLETMGSCVEVLQISVKAMEQGSEVAFTDAASASLIAHAALKGAALNVAVNIASLKKSSDTVRIQRTMTSLLKAGLKAAKRADKLVQGRFRGMA